MDGCMDGLMDFSAKLLVSIAFSLVKKTIVNVIKGSNAKFYDVYFLFFAIIIFVVFN